MQTVCWRALEIRPSARNLTLKAYVLGKSICKIRSCRLRAGVRPRYKTEFTSAAAKRDRQKGLYAGEFDIWPQDWQKFLCPANYG